MKRKSIFFSALIALLALGSSVGALDVEQGDCSTILSSKARVRIHYTSGLKAEIDPLRPDNVMTEVDVFPNGRRDFHKWIGGLLPLENPRGEYFYEDADATKFRIEPGESRKLAVKFISKAGKVSSGTIELAIDSVEKSDFGECQATFAQIVITTNWNHPSQPEVRISRLFVKEIGFFVASTVQSVKDGKPVVVKFDSTRVELIR
jgi:hypothetical protein